MELLIHRKSGTIVIQREAGFRWGKSEAPPIFDIYRTPSGLGADLSTYKLTKKGLTRAGHLVQNTELEKLT